MAYQTPANRQPLICGIDPDIDKSGVAVWDRSARRFTLLKTLDMAGIIDLATGYRPEQIRFCIEAGWLNEGLYNHNKSGLPRGFETWKEASKLAYMVKMGMQIGRNFGIGQTICHYLTATGFDVQELRPGSEKWDAATFMKMTGESKGYNPEIRDAAKLVIGL